MLKAHRRFVLHGTDPNENNRARCTCRIRHGHGDVDVACPFHLPFNYTVMAARHKARA